MKKKRINVAPKAEAQQLTEELRNGFGYLSEKLLENYRHCTWEALGYKNFVSYVETELKLSKSQAYRLLDDTDVTLSLLPLGKEVARRIPVSQKEILVDIPESERVETYRKAQEVANAAGKQVTIKILKEVIERKDKEKIDAIKNPGQKITYLPPEPNAPNYSTWLNEQLKLKTRELDEALKTLSQARKESLRLQSKNIQLQKLLDSSGIERESSKE